jgi:hypothetical protein
MNSYGRAALLGGRVERRPAAGRRPPHLVFGDYVSGCYIRSAEDPRTRLACLRTVLCACSQPQTL